MLSLAAETEAPHTVPLKVASQTGGAIALQFQQNSYPAVEILLAVG